MKTTLDFLQAVRKNAKSDFGDEERRRALICSSCPEKQKKIYSEFANAVIEEVRGYVCNRCQCPISTLVFTKNPKKICLNWSK